MSTPISEAATPVFAMTKHDVRRRRFNRLMLRVIQITALLSVVPLIAILFVISSKGLPGLNLSFILNSPLDNPRGIFNAIQGSLVMTFIALVASAPIGIFGGIYLNEYASPRVALLGELLTDIMLGIPSILAGLFIYFALVPIIGYSGWAGAMALTVLMIPVVMRTTQEVLRLVPAGLREASLALGVPRWKTTILVTCRTALSGLLTGVVLAISRGLGETAPLLLTAQSSNDTSLALELPMNSMTVAIYSNAGSSDPQLVASAWTTALVLFVIALLLNVSVRFKTINNRVI
jgi:phosphate transport system permease protein